METLNHYQTLKTFADASQKDVNRAYRRLAMRFHPDLHPQERQKWAEEQMKRINAAYEVLNDPETRARYDVAMGLRFDVPSFEKKPRENPAPPFWEEWYLHDPFYKIFSRMMSTRWWRRTAFANLVLEILAVGFLLVGAYLLLIEWNYMFKYPMQVEMFAPQWTFAGIWFVVLVATLFKLVPPHR